MSELVDVAVNLTDGMFSGKYHGKRAHDGDLDAILARAKETGVSTMICCAGSLHESRATLELMKKFETEGISMYSTVGVHPTRCGEFEKSGDPDAHLSALQRIIEENRGKVVAVGECGLDYDRLKFCGKNTQRKYFEKQFELAESTGLPMYLHDRNTGDDFLNYMRSNIDRISGGIVHSFTGTWKECSDLLEMGLYIGVNGCSMKTEENCEVVKQIPLDRLVLETDAPWCEIRRSHAGFQHIHTNWETVKKEKFVHGKCVKSRNEPCHVRQVLEVVAGLRDDVEEDKLAAITTENARRVLRLA